MKRAKRRTIKRPPIFYKYLTPDRIDVLEKLKIRFTQGEALNDPFECSVTIDEAFPSSDLEAANRHDGHGFINFHPGPPGYLDRFEKFSEAERAELNELQVIITQAILKSSMLILCLSERFDSLSMWTHYADNHRGLVIGFKASHPFFLGGQWKPHQGLDLAAANPVTYTPHRPQFRFATEITKTAAFFIKSPDWSYEKEWRMLRSAQDDDEVIFNKKDRIHLFPIPAESISCVTLGSAASSTLVERTKNALTNNSALSNVKLFQAEIDKRNYRLRTRVLQRSTLDAIGSE